VELGPSWKKRAVFLTPCENLLIPSNIPERGLVTNPATPMAIPLKKPGAPFCYNYSFGCLYKPVMATSKPVYSAKAADLVPYHKCLLFCIWILSLLVINFSSKVTYEIPCEQL